MLDMTGSIADQGNLDLSKTIEELGIDDYPPALTTEEKQATVGDLIKARFGLLFLRDGRWHDRPIVSSAWVSESTASHSDIASDKGYGYMWWTGTREGLFTSVKVKDHSYYAAGWGGHKIFVLPYRNLVIVHRVNTDWKGKMVSDSQIGRLLWHILDAAGETDIGEKPTLDGAKGVRLRGDELYNAVAGSLIKTEQFTAKFLQDNRLELWMKDKRIDAGKWWIKKDKCWLKAKILTGGRKVGLNLVLDGDTIKWYDLEDTLGGKGVYSKIN